MVRCGLLWSVVVRFVVRWPWPVVVRCGSVVVISHTGLAVVALLHQIFGIPISLESHTRGNSLKIVNRRCHYDLRKYSFCNRVTNIWNSLPEDIVTAPSVDSFKNRLDRYWHKSGTYI